MNNLSEYSDEELMQLYQADNFEAYEELFKRFSPSLYGYLKKTTASLQDVDDIFQKTVIKLDSYKDNYNPKYSFKSWLYTICKNVKRDFYKSEKNFSLFREKIQNEPILIFDLLEQNENGIQDYVHFSELSESEKNILMLKFNDDNSYEEISKILNITPANVRKKVSRAIKKLRMKAEGEV
jgi:RNA polymerase sigma-70 factor, ECF subfamily